MFTGIVSAVAKVVKADGSRIGIDHAWIARQLKIGGSVAVNGCCLTVVKRSGPVFFADVVPETFRHTNLGALTPGVEVNLELPCSPPALLYVHMVHAHIIAFDSSRSIARVGTGREAVIELPTALSR